MLRQGDSFAAAGWPATATCEADRGDYDAPGSAGLSLSVPRALLSTAAGPRDWVLHYFCSSSSGLRRTHSRLASFLGQAGPPPWMGGPPEPPPFGMASGQAPLPGYNSPPGASMPPPGTSMPPHGAPGVGPMSQGGGYPPPPGSGYPPPPGYLGPPSADTGQQPYPSPGFGQPPASPPMVRKRTIEPRAANNAALIAGVATPVSIAAGGAALWYFNFRDTGPVIVGSDDEETVYDSDEPSMSS